MVLNIQEEKFEIQPEVRSMEDDEGMVLLDLDAGKYFSLNRVGALVWHGIEQGHRRQEIFETLHRAFQVPENQINADVESFIASLLQKGLIRADV